MSTALQVTGLVSITAGALLLSVPVGLIVAGVGLVLVGVSVSGA